jgi:hypothetical protein
MNINRIVKTIFMSDFAAGLFIALKTMFSAKKTKTFRQWRQVGACLS